MKLIAWFLLVRKSACKRDCFRSGLFYHSSCDVLCHCNGVVCTWGAQDRLVKAILCNCACASSETAAGTIETCGTVIIHKTQFDLICEHCHVEVEKWWNKRSQWKVRGDALSALEKCSADIHGACIFCNPDIYYEEVLRWESYFSGIPWACHNYAIILLVFVRQKSN